VRDAVDRGVPLEQVEPGNNVTKDLARIILAGEAETEPLKAEKRGLLAIGRNIFARKSA
jgi:Flp pilus assembly CpaE family ATPase